MAAPFATESGEAKADGISGGDVELGGDGAWLLSGSVLRVAPGVAWGGVVVVVGISVGIAVAPC
jgi:hypothetical protein